MDNFDKLLDAIEHSERFSESELQTLLSDPETLRLYRALCAARSNDFIRDAHDASEIDRQWERFRRSRRKKGHFSWLLSRKAAAVVAFLIASCSIVVVGVSLSRRSAVKGGEPTNTMAETAVVAEEIALQATVPDNDTVIIFEDEKLDSILAEVAPYYGVKVDLKSPESKDVRLFLKWESSTALPELIEHLNSFDRINIFLKENTITDY